MKRYWLFVYSVFYPLGGFRDFKGSFTSKVECRTKAAEVGDYHFHIFDSEEQVIVQDTNKPDVDYVYKIAQYPEPTETELSEIYSKDFLSH